MINPLLEVASPLSLPSFTRIQPEHIEKAVKQVISENREIVEKLCDENKESDHIDIENLLNQLQVIDNRLSKVWSPVSHLNSVMNTEELRLAYTACLPLLSDYHTELGQNSQLFELINKIKNSNNEARGMKGKKCNSKCKIKKTIRSRLIDNLYKEFKLSGVALDEDKKLIFKEINSNLSKLTSKFSDNVLDETNAWTKSLNEYQLAGLSESAIDMLETIAAQHKKKGWLVSLDFPVFNAVMTFAEDRVLRQQVYKAYTTRASDQSKNTQFNNSKVMEEILQLRTKKANLLDFKNFAEQSLYKKMADTPEQVIGFLTDLLNQTRPQAEKEMAHLKSFAKTDLKIEQLQAWDLAYVSEKLQNKELDYSEEDLKPWFSVDSVLEGLFKLVEKLYSISIQQTSQRENDKQPIDVWHKDVKFYEIFDPQGKCIAGFYLDLFARQNKRGGAWMDSYCGRYQQQDQLQIPIAYINCNSSPATTNKPALFTHNEVITLFHEFGHGLHHMLTNIDYLDVSGINGVEWDAVELPSQFMENWCWHRQSLDFFAKHFETGELISDELFAKMQKSRHFNSALGMLRQLEFSLFDMRLHMDSKIKSYTQISALLEEVRKQTSILAAPEFNRFQNTFSHIFAGGYAAGYYSYKWAEVLSADVFDKFEENGIFDKQTANLFLHEILERGGSRPAKESFIAYRGREPDVSALLRHSGIETRDS